jgi:hypothetical protein
VQNSTSVSSSFLVTREVLTKGDIWLGCGTFGSAAYCSGWG